MVIHLGKDNFFQTHTFLGFQGHRAVIYRNMMFSKDIEVFEPDGVDDLLPIDDDQIQLAIRNPIGSEPLRKIAESRKNAVIIVDDLSRPTPAFAVMPHILEELKTGGIGEGDIRIIIGVGTHRPIKRFEQRRKLGKDIVDRVEVINHNAFTKKIKRYRRLLLYFKSKNLSAF